MSNDLTLLPLHPFSLSAKNTSHLTLLTTHPFSQKHPTPHSLFGLVAAVYHLLRLNHSAKSHSSIHPAFQSSRKPLTSPHSPVQPFSQKHPTPHSLFGLVAAVYHLLRLNHSPKSHSSIHPAFQSSRKPFTRQPTHHSLLTTPPISPRKEIGSGVYCQ